MRGFSNRATKPHRVFAKEGESQVLFHGHPKDLPPVLTIDFSRYAPERPRIVTSQERISSELGTEQPIAMSWDLAKRSFAQGFRCLWNIVRVLMARIKLRMRVAYHRVMQARLLPWALAGSGWGMSMGLVMLVVVR